MSSRQNVTDIFRRKGIVQAVPDFSLCPAMVDKFEKRFGHRDYRKEFGFPIKNAPDRFLRQEFKGWKERYYPGKEFLPGTGIDIWGVAHEPTPESMHMTRMYHPMEQFSDISEFREYPYPEFDGTVEAGLAEEVAKLHSEDSFVCGSMQCTVWETAWYMRSMEEMMVGMMTDDESTAYHLDRITDLASRKAEAFARADVDFLFLGDDIGMQHTIMMSAELYREWLKPRLAKVIAAARSANRDVIVGYHSCGFVEPFIEDLIEVGVDVLNPVQPECMDFKEIHGKYGSRLSFWGTLGTQTLFPHGTADEVYAKTLENLRIAGKCGGLLAAPTHLVEPEVPLDNILAYVKACRDFTP